MTTTHAPQDHRSHGPSFPPPVGAANYPLDTDRLDRAIDSLGRGIRTWTGMSLSERADLMERTHRSITLNVARWTRTATDIKHLDPESNLVGEEWISGPYAALMGFSTVAASLRALAAGKSPLDSVTATPIAGGRLSWQVLPAHLQEAVLFNGFSAEVWTLPGARAEEIRAEAGLGALDQDAVGEVGLVLGAGNITSIGPLDVLTEIVAHNRASLLKINPTLAPLLSIYREALGPLIEADLLRVVQGGAEVGSYLTEHPGIAHVHITGSSQTHDRIVWGTAGGPGSDMTEPLLTKPITSELGGVSPVIVVPGDWSDADLRFQAENIATMRLHNAGHNCISAQTIVVDANWPQRQAFLTALGDVLETAGHRDAWYPGSGSRLDAASADHAEVLSFDGGRRLIVGIDDEHSEVERTEYFAAVLGIKDITATSTEDFLHQAVDYANDRLSGTLGANVVIAPKELRHLGGTFEDEIERLRYGSIGINVWTGLAFLTASATWGAYPGHTLADVQSGIGVVHNGMLIPDVERTVVRGPFRPFPRSFAGGELSLFPKPPWFITARSAQTTGRLLTEFAMAPSWAKLPGIFLSAFRA